MKTDADNAQTAVPMRAAYCLLAITALCWGGNAVLGRLAVGEVSPGAVVLFRWLGVCVLLMPFVIGEIARDWAALRPRLPLLLAMGGLGFTVFNTMFYVAAHHTTAVNLGILQGAIPVFVLLGAYAAYRAPVTPLQTAGVALTVLGVCLVAAGGDLARLAVLGFNYGDAIMLMGCMLYAGYTVGLRRIPPVPSLSLFAVLAGAALLTAIPLAVTEYAMGAFQWPSEKGWLIILMIVLFPSFLGQVAYILGVRAIGPGRAGVFVNLVPVFSPMLAVLVLGEPFMLYHAAALCLVIGGISLSERFKPAAAGPPAAVPHPEGVPGSDRAP